MNAERFIPDENPPAPCEGCGETELWSAIKESEEWQVSDDPGVPFLCPDCRKSRYQHTDS